MINQQPIESNIQEITDKLQIQMKIMQLGKEYMDLKNKERILEAMIYYIESIGVHPYELKMAQSK